MMENKTLNDNSVDDIVLTSEEVAHIKTDRLQYTKNKASSNLTYLAILFNALYFANIYSVLQRDAGSYYFNFVIGLSVLFNLCFMLFAFLASEGVKNYHFGYSIALIAVGILQVVRLFYIPLKAFKTNIDVTVGTEIVAKRVMESGQFTYVVVLLIASSVACIIAGIIGAIKSKKLSNYLKTINQD